ncbi:mannonate dehydratase [Paenisporosarcina antarctica]|uniref:Mannonate dehydratase n=1 Tax=Paenisporosarcina antarctica TaxID=417367 RepID=A0A4P7A0U7_9BACL|nr:mannonate dehydratase [Paenisporosarcina antarctica]QBP42620.1 mannonate dehydratase [Paenisporosarcina antarctica]
MQMTFRWFGQGNDNVSLSHIKQIPGVTGIVWALHDVRVGEKWPLDKILEVKKQADQYGLNIDVVESVNIHEDIKLGLSSRQQYIDNYKETIKELSKVGVKVICYNFMPVFDWIRTDLFKELEDGSTALFYEKSKVENIQPNELVNSVFKNKDFTLPGWEPERLDQLSELFEAYKNVTEEKLWDNLQYFLEEIIPVAEQHDIKMAIHPDDPPWPVFGLPRIINSSENIRRLYSLVDSPYNGLTFCSGSLGANGKNNLTGIVKEFGERIHLAHIRNLKRFENGDFIETSHKMSDGSIDVVGIVKAFHEIGFTGYTRPDHGRHIWGEVCRPGYGLYDRALGIMYLWGIWDTLQQTESSV